MDQVRIGMFLGVFVIVALLEAVLPHRKRNLPRWLRWYSNFGIIGLSNFLTKLILPLTAISIAQDVQVWQVGLFEWFKVSFWVEVIAVIVLLDCVIYWQHRIFHRVPILWRLHKMHHQDIDLDVTSGARFHPIEIFLSTLIKIGCVIGLGAHPVAVSLFEILLNATAMFNHGNILLPKWLDRSLRKVIVTPEMHKVHHSTDWKELNTNFGFNLSIWDYLFKSYKFLPTKTTTEMQVGVKDYRERKFSHLHWLLAIPFLKDKSR